MKKIFFTLLISICFIQCKKASIQTTTQIGPACPWADSSARHPKNAALTTLLSKYKAKGLPGISLLINDRNGTWIGAAGKADLKNDIDFVPGTVSKAASITKFFMGVLIFKMMEDSANSGIGYSAFNTPVSKWLPTSILSKVANGNIITLGQCMNHETGIPDVIEQDPFYLAVLNNPNKNWDPEELLQFIYNKPPLFAPSDTAIYSNTNTILVKLIAEAASGKSNQQLFKQYIFTPLNLQNTYYQPYDALPQNVAQGYFDLYNNGSIMNVSNLVTGSGNGYGGIYSNLYDLKKLMDAVLINRTFLSSQSLAMMQRYGKRDGTNFYGYGIQKSYINGNDYGIGHKGRDLGYSANLFYFPSKGVTHIFFVNYGTDSDSGLKAIFTQFLDEMIQISLQ